ncbi:sugar transferase [bacterium]|nr:sugar transferase [bacterium]
MRPKGPLFWFVVVDLTTLLIAFYLAWWFFEQTDPNASFDHHLGVFAHVLWALPALLAAKLAILGLLRLYDFITNRTDIDIIYLAVWAVGAGAAFEVLFLSYVKVFHIDTMMRDEVRLAVQISRALVAYNALFTFLGITGWRLMYLRRRRRWGYDRARVLVVGAGEVSRSVSREIDSYSAQGHEVVGFVEDGVEAGAGDSPLLGRVEDIPRLARDKNVHEILIASQRTSRRRLLEILALCRETDCTLWLMPDVYETIVGQVDCQMAGIPLIQLSTLARKRRALAVKRALDVAVALMVIFLFALPALVISVLIKTTSRGKVIFGQERVGQHHAPFTLYKFRTMREGAEEESGPVLSSPDDPRVTGVGRILRRFHLDEIPQFWNVLWGDMSLVGPRPERPVFVARFEAEIPAYRLRFEVKPGMTGLAQVYGHYASSPEHKLRYDLSYIHNFNPLLDLKILLATLLHLFTGQRPRGL